MSHLGDLLSAHLDGELSDTEVVQVTEHLYECAGCRRELDDLREVRAAVRALPVLEPPIPLLARERRTRSWTAAVAASAAAVALAIGLVVTPQTAQSLDLDSMAGRHQARVVVDPGVATLRGPVAGP
jgi:predicted anti-sigma-YlaC factor YlaD